MSKQRSLIAVIVFTFTIVGLMISRYVSTDIATATARLQSIEATSDRVMPLTSSDLLPWQLDPVDMPGYFSHMSDRSLHYDSAGTLHLVYGGDRLYYATFDGADWSVEIVDESIGTGMGASLDLDAADRPHISYVDMVNYKLRYAFWTGESWDIQILDRAYPYPERTAISVDSAGQPHIAYKKNEWIPPNSNCPGMGYAHWTGSDWQLERFTDCGSYVSLALDTADKPHISFNNGGEIKYASKPAGTWSIDSIASSSYENSSSLAVDSADHPHAVYVDDEESDRLVYTYWNGANWISDTIQPADTGLNVSLALDFADTPHIGYQNEYITWSGSQWIVTDTLGYGSFSSNALDGDSKPAISYGFEIRVFCAYWDGATWVTDTIDTGGASGQQNSLALDSQGQPGISYYRRTGYGGASVVYAQRSGKVWTTEIITGTYFPAYPHTTYDVSLAIDGNDDPHVSFWYSDFYDSDLHYGKRVGEEWQLETIADNANSPHTLAIDSYDRPHISYRYNNMLRYGYRSASGWIIDDVTGSRGSHPILALDDADSPHIIYANENNGVMHLKYAVWTGTEWQFDDIDVFAANKIDAASLTLDEAGNPHVAYVVEQENSFALRYAFWNGSDWIFQTIDEYPIGISYPVIALDAGGYPYITYSYSYQGLQIATQVDGEWAVQQIVRNRGSDLSFAIDGIFLYISYFDIPGRGLVLAGPAPLTEHLYLPIIDRS